GMMLLEKARALAALGERDDAIGIALGTVPRFEHAHPTSAARAYAIAAEILCELEDTERGLELYELAVETSPTADRHVVAMLRAIAEIHQRAGRVDEAFSYYRRALDVQGAPHADQSARRDRSDRSR